MHLILKCAAWYKVTLLVKDTPDDCIADINSNMANYLQNANGRTTVFKVYKLIINSYKNLEQENSANEKLNDLVRLTHMPQGDVQNELNNTPLTMIE